MTKCIEIQDKKEGTDFPMYILFTDSFSVLTRRLLCKNVLFVVWRMASKSDSQPQSKHRNHLTMTIPCMSMKTHWQSYIQFVLCIETDGDKMVKINTLQTSEISYFPATAFHQFFA